MRCRICSKELTKKIEILNRGRDPSWKKCSVRRDMISTNSLTQYLWIWAQKKITDFFNEDLPGSHPPLKKNKNFLFAVHSWKIPVKKIYENCPRFSFWSVRFLGWKKFGMKLGHVANLKNIKFCYRLANKCTNIRLDSLAEGWFRWTWLLKSICYIAPSSLKPKERKDAL